MANQAYVHLFPALNLLGSITCHILMPAIFHLNMFQTSFLLLCSIPKPFFISISIHPNKDIFFLGGGDTVGQDWLFYTQKYFLSKSPHLIYLDC